VGARFEIIERCDGQRTVHEIIHDCRNSTESRAQRVEDDILGYSRGFTINERSISLQTQSRGARSK